MPADSSVVPDELDELLGDERQLRDARVAHRRRALTSGDISHMLVALLSECSMAAPEALLARVSALVEEAEALAS